MEDREMFKATCSDCGIECEVPFEPTEGKPVRCKDCFAKGTLITVQHPGKHLLALSILDEFPCIVEGHKLLKVSRAGGRTKYFLLSAYIEPV